MAEPGTDLFHPRMDSVQLSSSGLDRAGLKGLQICSQLKILIVIRCNGGEQLVDLVSSEGHADQERDPQEKSMA